MTYLPFVYLILLSPEEYYNNKVSDGYQPIPLANKKLGVHDKLQQPQLYIPYYYLTPFVNGPGMAPDPPDKGMKDEGGGEDEMRVEDESVEMTTMRSEEEATEDADDVTWKRFGYAGYVSHCTDGYAADENGNCRKTVPGREKEPSLDRKKRAVIQNATKDRMIFKLSKKISVRDRRSAEEKKSSKKKNKEKPGRKERSTQDKKPSYADVVKYGRRGVPLPKPTPSKNENNRSSTSKLPSASTTTTKPPSVPSVAPLSKPEVIKPEPTKPTKAPSRLINRNKPTPPSTGMKSTSKPESSVTTPRKPAAEDPSLQLINSEKNPNLDLPRRKTTTSNPFLYLATAYCDKGYKSDTNGNCLKTVATPDDKKHTLDRKKRNTDFNSQIYRRLVNEAERNRQGRISEYTFQRREKKIENDTRKTETYDRSFQDISDKAPSDEKNAASDGFGYISKECSKLVPGLVSDGAGGCTKAVKVKEKILQLERKKRGARTAFFNFIDPSNRLPNNNFTITITIKGLNKQLNFTNEAQVQPLDGGDKAVADNGFGVTSSKCDNLIPGLVPDGVGGCTKAVTSFRQRNKFSFIVRNVENSQPVIDLDYENPEPELVSINPGDDDDPDADII